MANTDRRDLKTHWVPVLLLLLTAIIYGRVLQHKFLLNWDDLTYVVKNDAIQGLSWQNVKIIFSRFYIGNYAPLHLLSYSLDYSLWGLNPAGFLTTNVLLHAANGCLFYYLLMRLGLSRIGAAFAAVVFIVHPVQVESVAWVSERKNLLCMTFSLASFHGFVSYRQREDRSCWTAYAGALAWFVAALLTKAIAVVVPPILVFIDFCAIPKEKRHHWFSDKVPFFVAAIVLSVVTIMSQEEMIAEGRAVFQMDHATNLFTMVPVIVEYIAMVFWPIELSAVYTPKVREAADPAFWLSSLCLAIIAVTGVFLWMRHRRLLMWYAVFFVALIPVLHIVPLPTLMNDRYLYFPMLGATALAGLGLDRGLASKTVRWRLAAVCVAVGISIALSYASFERIAVWRDDVTLWRDVTEKTPKSPQAWLGLGISLFDAGRPVEAIQAYRQAIAEDPFYAMALNNLGATYNTIGQSSIGRPFLLRALQVDPEYFDAYMNLGIGFRMSGDLAGAERAFSAALSIRPQSPEARDALRDLKGAVR